MKVSVRDITTRAAINRGTFYLHYEDKYNLLPQMEENLLRGLELHLQRLKPVTLLLKTENGQISALAVEVFRYIQTNAERFQVLWVKIITLVFISASNYFLSITLAKNGVKQDVLIQKDYLSSFATSAFFRIGRAMA